MHDVAWLGMLSAVLVILFGWVKIDLGNLRKDLSALQTSIHGWRPFLDALVREMTTDIAKRVLAKPPSNPTRKAERLPDDVLADIREMLEAFEPEKSSEEAQFYADAAMHLLNSTWGIEKSAQMMRDLGLDAEEFIGLLIGAMREIHEAQVA